MQNTSWKSLKSTIKRPAQLLDQTGSGNTTVATWNSWATANEEWTVFGTVPYQHVSMNIQSLFFIISTNTYAIILDSSN